LFVNKAPYGTRLLSKDPFRLKPEIEMKVPGMMSVNNEHRHTIEADKKD
jgi:hypothetical protein